MATNCIVDSAGDREEARRPPEDVPLSGRLVWRLKTEAHGTKLRDTRSVRHPWNCLHYQQHVKIHGFTLVDILLGFNPKSQIQDLRHRDHPLSHHRELEE